LDNLFARIFFKFTLTQFNRSDKMEQIEKQTFSRHILFSLFNGIASGVVLSLQEVIAQKTL